MTQAGQAQPRSEKLSDSLRDLGFPARVGRFGSLACGRRAAAGVEQLVGYQERFPGPAHEKGEPQQIPPADCDGLPEFGQKPRNMGDDSLSMSSGPCPAPTVRIHGNPAKPGGLTDSRSEPYSSS